MITTHRHTGLANQGKNQQLLDLFPAFRAALVGLQALTVRELHSGLPLSSWRVMAAGTLSFTTALSARQMKSAQNQTHAAMSSWQEALVVAVRGYITGSSLPEERRTILYRVNASRAWWAQQLDLPWEVTSDGELVHISAKRAKELAETGGVDKKGLYHQILWLPVTSEDLKLARRLVKQAIRTKAGMPNLSRVRTIGLDSIVARVEQARDSATAGYWVKIATLTRGKPLWLPLARNTYFEEHLSKAGRLCGSIQLHLVTDSHGHPVKVDASLIIETPDAPTRTQGRALGLDWGMSSALFATSDGRLMGAKMLARLRELDILLMDRAAVLQRAGLPLKKDPTYNKLNQRIRDYVTNEIGRLLNRIAAAEGEQAVAELVVEDLDFRGGGLSRRLNRLITRTGRAVLKTRLAALTTKHGITVTEVFSAYTSQECSGCRYTHKANRKSQARFVCGFCGKKLHADINAARTVKGRRSLPAHDVPGKSGRNTTLRMLDQRHRDQWRLRPAPGADPTLAGRRARTAA